jgi:tRNA nucleotidyltransferase/poly(A) polymerase
MAELEKQTRDSIIKNGHLLSTLTKERIWEEIKKSYSQVKYFPRYLNLLFELDLMKYIFPDLKLNSDIKESDSLPIYFANILKGNDPQKLERTLIMDLKIESEISSKVCHLIKLLNLSPENAFLMYKDKIKCHVPNDMVLDWAKISGMDRRLVDAFIEYKPSVSADDLMNQGLKGKELGDEIKRLETEEFRRISKRI